MRIFILFLIFFALSCTKDGGIIKKLEQDSRRDNILAYWMDYYSNYAYVKTLKTVNISQVEYQDIFWTEMLFSNFKDSLSPYAGNYIDAYDWSFVREWVDFEVTEKGGIEGLPSVQMRCVYVVKKDKKQENLLDVSISNCKKRSRLEEIISRQIEQSQKVQYPFN